MSSSRAAVGFRVKSGSGDCGSRGGIGGHATRSGASVRGSRQPFHAVMAARKADAPHLERRLCRLVRQVTRKSVRELLKDYNKNGRRLRHAGLVVGSVIDPATIANDHIRAHALEGRLFRTALEEAVRSHGVACGILVERTAYAQAARELRRSETDLKRAMTDLGRAVQGPWRADEKTAALAAWLALHRHGAVRDTAGA